MGPRTRTVIEGYLEFVTVWDGNITTVDVWDFESDVHARGNAKRLESDPYSPEYGQTLATIRAIGRLYAKIERKVLAEAG